MGQRDCESKQKEIFENVDMIGNIYQVWIEKETAMAEIVYAARQAVLDVIDLMVATEDMTRSDAYALCSLQADLLVTQLVNGVNGIHARMPKAIFDNRKNQ